MQKKSGAHGQNASGDIWSQSCDIGTNPRFFRQNGLSTCVCACARTHTLVHCPRSPETATKSRSGAFAFRIRSDRPPRAVLLAAPPKAGKASQPGATASKMHRACCWGTGPQQCPPSCFDPIVCTHRRPLGTLLATPTHHPLQPSAQPTQLTARNIIHAQPAFATTRSQRSWPPMHAAYC